MSKNKTKQNPNLCKLTDKRLILLVSKLDYIVICFMRSEHTITIKDKSNDYLK